MSKHQIGTREEWLAARLILLDAEKEHTRRGDALAVQRQALPWVRMAQDYRFETEEGSTSLQDLFGGRSQLLVYHFMFGPDYSAGCPSCSSIADGFNGYHEHLANHDVAFWAVSRAPLPRLLEYRDRMGWTFPWASAADSTFNFDLGVSFTLDQQRGGAIEYNYRSEPPVRGKGRGREAIRVAAMAGTNPSTFLRERPGMSAFVCEHGEVFHTYSTFSRGLDALWGAYQWLDRAPLGRNEQGYIWRRRDEYGLTDSPARVRQPSQRSPSATAD